VCVRERRFVVVRQIVYNAKKFVFCKFARKKFLQSNLAAIHARIDKMRIELDKILRVKLGFYGAICSKEMQNFVNEKKRSIKINQNFCVSIFTKFKEYLIWKNKTLADYTRRFYSYMRCFRTDGAQKLKYTFGVDNNRTRRLAKFATHCTDPEKAASKKCLKACSTFSLFRFSKFFDGDKRRFSRLYAFALKTIRMYNYRFKARGVKKPVPAKPRALKLVEKPATRAARKGKKQSAGRKLAEAVLPEPVAIQNRLNVLAQVKQIPSQAAVHLVLKQLQQQDTFVGRPFGVPNYSQPFSGLYYSFKLAQKPLRIDRFKLDIQIIGIDPEYNSRLSQFNEENLEPFSQFQFA